MPAAAPDAPQAVLNGLDSDLEGARLFGTDLSRVRNLDPNSLASALGDATTKLPEAMQRPASWPDRELGGTERDDWIAKLKRPAEN
jgi:uncharacterized protein YjbI with pentapeptide repeats